MYFHFYQPFPVTINTSGGDICYSPPESMTQKGNMKGNYTITRDKLIFLLVYGIWTFVAQPRLAADNISLFCVSLCVHRLPLTFLHSAPCQKKQEQTPPSWRERDVCKYGETCSHSALAALHLLLLLLSLVDYVHKCTRGKKKETSTDFSEYSSPVHFLF